MPERPHPIFLIVDHNPEGRMLLGRTLLRKFPTGIIKECATVEAAMAALNEGRVDAIISHRAIGYDGVATIALLHGARPELPLIMVSGTDRSKEARDAGATEFIRFDAWLMVGTVVERILKAPPDPTKDQPRQ